MKQKMDGMIRLMQHNGAYFKVHCKSRIYFSVTTQKVVEDTGIIRQVPAEPVRLEVSIAIENRDC